MRRPAGDWLLAAGWALLVAAAFWALVAGLPGLSDPHEAPVTVHAPR